MFRKGLLGLCLLLLLAATTFSLVKAQTGFPPLPHAFYGRVYIHGEEAPAGTRIEGRGEAVETGIQGNPIETVAEGFYGSTDNSVINLVVQGWVTDGTPIEFYVNGQKAHCNDGSGWEESYPYQAGGITSLDLWVGSLSTQPVIPTATKTPTFAPTVPRTATPTAKPSTPTAAATATPTADPSSPVAANTTVTPTEQWVRTGTTTRTAAAGLALTTAEATAQAEREASQQTAVSDAASLSQEEASQKTADSGNNLQVQEEPSGSNAGLVVGIVGGTLVILVAIWLVIRNKRKAHSEGDQDLL